MFDALYIGRFQPFHNGHLHALKHILKDNDKVLIALGSSDKSYQLDNPLTVEERTEIIQMVLDEEGIDKDRYKIVPIEDIGNDDLWVKHVQNSLPLFKNVYSGTPLVQKLFKKDKKNPVFDVNFLEGHNATMIRERALHDQEFVGLVSQCTAGYLSRIGFTERMKAILANG